MLGHKHSYTHKPFYSGLWHILAHEHTQLLHVCTDIEGVEASSAVSLQEFVLISVFPGTILHYVTTSTFLIEP